MPELSAPPVGFTLRTIGSADLEFLCRIYASTRDDVHQVEWAEGQKEAFLRFQFQQQHAHYHTNFPDAGYYVIERAGQAIGRLYVHWKRGNALHLMDITLLPEVRGQGIGTTFIQWLMDETVRTAQRMTLYVEDFNPAYHLYQRLGFVPGDKLGIYSLMEWKPVA